MQSVACLTAITYLTADPAVASLIPAQSNAFVEIDHEKVSTVILLPSIDSRSVVVSYKRKYVSTKLAQEKSVNKLNEHS